MTIRIVGLKERHTVLPSEVLVDTTSKSRSEWTTELSPFHLGPCTLYDGHTAQRMENAWQYAKCYADHVDVDGQPSVDYWAWAKAGWAQTDAVRYPRGKGARPAFSWWEGKPLGYIEARLSVYWPLYRDAVAKTAAFARLTKLVAAKQNIVLFDFDGYDYEARNMTFADAMRLDTRPMGHAFVLKAMLLHGPTISAQQVLEFEAPPPTPQASLF